MGNWKIEGLDATRGCFRKAWQDALAYAHTQDRVVTVRYLGPKTPGNRNPAASDFLAKPDGTLDHKIDPTWWENK